MNLHPLLEEFIRYSESFIGVHYSYGGNNRLTGLDCSGYICEVLRPTGLIGNKEDLSAQGLFDKFMSSGRLIDASRPYVGALVFYGKSTNEIVHVALATSAFTIIESGGGSSEIKTLEDAKRVGACIRKRHIAHRSDRIAAIYPRYPWQ